MDAPISVVDLSIGHRDVVLMHDLTFSVPRGAVFVIMGSSGSGKTTLFRNMIGLMEPLAGDVLYRGESFTHGDSDDRERLSRRFGVLFQSGALWGSMTLAENVALPMHQFTRLGTAEIHDLVSLKLDLVGLKGFEDFYPAQISGGMQKRAGIARAMALDPEIMFLDEPSAGLDPLTSRRLDDLILELRESLDATIVVVTHELDSIFAIGTDSVFLDTEAQTMIAQGNPRELRDHSSDARVRNFLTRGNAAVHGAST
jgi:phospholipid/cholesterol/gamma-HCH transport system ATP-binding protein